MHCLTVYYVVFMHRFMGEGLFSISDYETWKPRRKIYDPTFNKRWLCHYTM